ncbi:PREDICTED: uncharacterized protein LOC108566112 [Nicrophorus vespilloides]|uniref:Uncharacterized protein LOC108566112 n=1 Tax=Nicrophorus vespilloides TaxID=110193 RepID=A0ABM1N3C3_NICVS|nr:PREDICTED: uncharacterized protein LOC108566112 [Nicrophorus vespilloides]
MKCIAILLSALLVGVSCNGTAKPAVFGTVLFSPSDMSRDCWSADNVALLTSRMLMRNLMPRMDTVKVEDDSFISDIIEYFRLLLEVIRGVTSGKSKHIMLLAFTDTLGGYMRHFILPVSKYAYYAGNVEYASIVKLYQLYDELKNFLRTNGNGWAKPSKRLGKHIHAKPISLQSPTPSTDPCQGLIYSKRAGRTGQKTRASKGCSMEVPLPFFDSKTHPSAIAVPFKTFGLRNLESRVSAYILVKFYVAVSKCMASRHVDEQDVHKFNTNVYAFIMAKVMPHLCDDKFYAAFGGVLRILETIKQDGKSVKAMGNINIMPDTDDREPFPDMVDEGDALGPPKYDKKSKNNLILMAALATIIIWFCLGAAFVCCRIRISKLKKEDKVKAIGQSEEGDDDEMAKGSEDQISCRDETCPAFMSSRSSTNENANYALMSNKLPSVSTKSSSNTNTTEGESDSNSKIPELRVHSVQYYPPSFACHTSMTGKMKVDSSTDEYTSREEPKRPFVFGYDFQTSSEETSPRETTDGENDLGGNMSK